MKKFITFFAYALLLGSMTFTLTACGDDDDDAGGSSAGGLTPAGKAAQMVDLGLPSGTLWADRNVGADKPEAYGSYFAWGETVPKSDYSWSTYKYGNGDSKNNLFTKYCQDAKYGKDGYTDSYTELLHVDDAARVNWGGNWRMPSEEQIKELYNNTDNTWVDDFEGTGVSGRKFTNKKDSSKFIFLPAAGYRDDTSLLYAGSYGLYWSRTLDYYPSNAYNLTFSSGKVGWGSSYRDDGHTVRPVVAP